MRGLILFSTIKIKVIFSIQFQSCTDTSLYFTKRRITEFQLLFKFRIVQIIYLLEQLNPNKNYFYNRI